MEAVKCAKGDLEDSKEAWATYRKLLSAYASMRPLMDAFADNRIAEDGSFTPPTVSPESSGTSRGRTAPVFANKSRPGSGGPLSPQASAGRSTEAPGSSVHSGSNPGGGEKVCARNLPGGPAAAGAGHAPTSTPEAARPQGSGAVSLKQGQEPAAQGGPSNAGPGVVRGAGVGGRGAVQVRAGSAGKRGKLGFVVDHAAVHEKMQSEL